MDFEQVADELYALPPSRFTASRNEAAERARADDDPELAARLRGLRRPTTGAWLGNLLVREQPDEVRALLELGSGLRAAQSRLAGDRLRELGARRREVVAALVRQAGAEAVRAGQRVGAGPLEDLERTLHAVLADPEAADAFASGRLTAALTAAPRPGLPAPPTPGADRNEVDADAGLGRERLARARRDAAEAGREAEAAARAADRARHELDRVAARHQSARDRVESATERLERARAEERRAAAEERTARERVATTDREARRTGGRARDARAHLDHLERTGSDDRSDDLARTT